MRAYTTAVITAVIALGELWGLVYLTRDMDKGHWASLPLFITGGTIIVFTILCGIIVFDHAVKKRKEQDGIQSG